MRNPGLLDRCSESYGQTISYGEFVEYTEEQRKDFEEANNDAGALEEEELNEDEDFADVPFAIVEHRVETPSPPPPPEKSLRAEYEEVVQCETDRIKAMQGYNEQAYKLCFVPSSITTEMQCEIAAIQFGMAIDRKYMHEGKWGDSIAEKDLKVKPSHEIKRRMSHTEQLSSNLQLQIDTECELPTLTKTLSCILRDQRIIHILQQRSQWREIADYDLCVSDCKEKFVKNFFRRYKG